MRYFGRNLSAIIGAVRFPNYRLPVFVALCLAAASGGCAAVTNPAADGVPVRHVPPELLAKPRNEEQTIPLTLLEQPHPAVYTLAPGDVLGVYVEGYLGERNQPLPVYVGSQLQSAEGRRLSSAVGYPVPVQADGTIELPQVGALQVSGLSLVQAAAAIRKVYTGKGLLKEETDRVLTSLLNPRQQHILVFRQEAANLIIGPEGITSSNKRGTGHEIDLPAYENDVLHALARTGGLPGLDAYNAIVIFHGCFNDDAGRSILRQTIETRPPGRDLAAVCPCVQTVRIPLRIPPGCGPAFRPEDVLLQTGDVVFLESRDNELFYTGGLLPPGAHVLPRDYDLDVVAAISQVHGPLVNGAFAVSNLSGALIAPGMGGPSPSLLTVIRQTPHGQVNIEVDLDRALQDRRERILVQAGDVLILQEKPGEALARYFYQSFANFDLIWTPIHSKLATGVVDLSAPDRLPGRLGTVNIPGQ